MPLITVGLSIFVKYVTRNDRYSGFKKEDLAVGLDISIIALLIFITSSTQLVRATEVTTSSSQEATQLASVPWVIVAFVLGIWGVSTIVRKAGWENEDQLNWLWGIALPDTFGVLALLLVVDWML